MWKELMLSRLYFWPDSEDMVQILFRFFSLQIDSSQFRANQTAMWMLPGGPFHSRQRDVSEQEKLRCTAANKFIDGCIQFRCSRALAPCTLTHWHDLLGLLNGMESFLMLLLWLVFSPLWQVKISVIKKGSSDKVSQQRHYCRWFATTIFTPAAKMF